MTQEIISYAEAFKAAGAGRDDLLNVVNILEAVPQVKQQLCDPTVALEKKHVVITSIFPEVVRDTLMVLVDKNEFDRFEDIFEAYKQQEAKIDVKESKAELLYVTKPTERQLEGIKSFLMKKFDDPEIDIELHEDKSLGSGFVLRYGNQEFDWSEQGRLSQLSSSMVRALNMAGSNPAISEENIVEILKADVESFELHAGNREIGVVKTIGDGIARIDGIDHAFYGEIVVFDTGTKGEVQDIQRDSIGVILFGNDNGIKEGTRVVRTGQIAGVPVGEEYLGRVVNALGEPIDGEGEIPVVGYRPIEFPAPSIVDRKSVNVPLETGILSIDSMFPIGRGQRELIIGDRQTGKTSIALDTILNQKGKDVICVYVAIGQKESTVAQLVNTLKKKDAFDYTIVVSATAAESASMQYIAPYAGTAMAEYFMYQGKDCLIIYDDLSKHAVAYRSISLLLERSPGREAYPGDVFYLHSRLLERSARLSAEAGGGSITALPIIETQAGDVSAYIPTNVISITDGQIYLESDLFNAGQRPAVNVGLSVSRVGGAAQTKAMKKAAGSMRVDLAQYREMEVFTQFSSDLDDTTKKQLAYGSSLMELLKQPLGRPFTMAEQVITLAAATGHVFAEVPKEEVKSFQLKLLDYFASSHSDIISEIETSKTLTDSTKGVIQKIARDFRKEVFGDEERQED